MEPATLGRWAVEVGDSQNVIGSGDARVHYDQSPRSPANRSEPINLEFARVEVDGLVSELGNEVRAAPLR